MIMAMIGWVLRFGFFGLGNTSPSGVGLLMLSCIVYGVAFDFFNVSGGCMSTRRPLRRYARRPRACS